MEQEPEIEQGLKTSIRNWVMNTAELIVPSYLIINYSQVKVMIEIEQNKRKMIIEIQDTEPNKHNSIV